MRYKSAFLRFLKNNIFLGLLIVALSVSRFLYLGKVPGLHGDEALYGIKTYIMMHGKPFTPNGFNAYTGPLVSYLRIPFFTFIGIDIFSLRLPIVILSLITTFYIYKLIGDIYDKRTGVFAALLFLTMPWSFIYSRFSDETHTSLIFFAICGLYYLYRLKVHYSIVSAIFGGLFLGLGVFTHLIFIVVCTSYFIYFFTFCFRETKTKKGYIIALSISLIFLFLRLFLIFRARLVATDGIYYQLGEAISIKLIYKLISSVPYLMNMLDGAIFYLRTTGQILFYVIPYNSILFIVSFAVLIFRYKYYPEFEDKDRMFIWIFMLNFVGISIFSMKLSLRYFMVTLMFATVLIAVFLGTAELKKWLRVGIISFIIVANCSYIFYNYIYSFRQDGGKASIFWAGNFFENSTGFIDSAPLYDYLKKRGIVYLWVPEEFIRWPLIFLDFNLKRLNIKAKEESIITDSVYFISYKDERPETHNLKNQYSIVKENAPLKNYDIFLMKK